METIIRQGDVGDELCVLHRGEVSVLAGRDGGSVAEVARLGPGTFFGEMSLLLGERRRATIRASTECDIITIGKDALQPIFTAHPEFIERISTVLSSRLVALDANLAERAKRAASMPPAEESKADFLRRVRAFFALG
jgi:CRP-like cAMP-binding protein